MSQNFFFSQNLQLIGAELSDLDYMKLAYQAALRGKISCYPNPAVGCVIVKDQQIIGIGGHEYAGTGHAEVVAVNCVKTRFPDTYAQLLKGATAYVTLEPCSHYGRTPPCCDLLIAQQVGRVVVGSLDLSLKVNGQGIARFLQNKIRVDYLLLPELIDLNLDFFALNQIPAAKFAWNDFQAYLANEANSESVTNQDSTTNLQFKQEFITEEGEQYCLFSADYLSLANYLRSSAQTALSNANLADNSLPYLRLKIAQTADGRTALPNHDSKWITNPASRSYVQALRLHADAVLCTAKTVVIDNAKYNIRYQELPEAIKHYLSAEQVPEKLVVILDNSQILSGKEEIFKQAQRILIVSTQPHRLQAQGLAKVSFLETNLSQGAWTAAEFRSLLQKLKADYGIKDLLLESGSQFSSFCLEQGFFSELHLFIGSKIFGAGNISLNFKHEFSSVSQTPHLELLFSQTLGNDLYLVYAPHKP